ncbi:MAG: hypothetical protein AAGA68_14515 [Pseudomonadota bacterium]
MLQTLLDRSTVDDANVLGASSNVLLQLVGTVFSLCLLSWFTVDPLKYVYLEHSRAGGDLSSLPWALLGSFNVLDYVLLASSTTLALLILIGEVRGRQLSRTLQCLSPAGLKLLMLGLFTWFAHSLITPGALVGGDYSSHVARIAHFRDALTDGEFALWNNYSYAGSSFLEFTGPFYFVFGGAIDWLLRAPNLTTKLILFISHIASGACFYWCLRQHALGRFGACLGALVFAGSLSHLHQVLMDGNHPQAITYLLMPLTFTLLTQLLTQDRYRPITWFSLTLLNGLLLVHHQSMAKAFGSLMILHSLVYLASHPARWRVIVPLSTSAVASIALALVSIVPVLLEREAVMLYEDVHLFSWALPSADVWKALLLWNPVPSGHLSYLGATGLLVMGAAVVATFTRASAGNGRTWLLVSLVLCTAFALTDRGHHVKFMVATLFGYAFLVGIAADHLRRTLGVRSPLLAGVTLLVVLDLCSTALQPYNRTDKSYLDDAGRHLEATPSLGRVLQTRTWGGSGELFASIGPGAGILSYYRSEQLTGAHNLAASRAHNYIGAVIKRVEHDLRSTGALAEDTRTLLALLNVHTIVNDTGRQMGLPASVVSNAEHPTLGAYIDVGPAPAVTYAPQLAVQDPSALDKPAFWNEDFAAASDATIRVDEYLDELLERMALDRERGIASQLVVRHAPDAALAPPPTDADTSITVSKHQVHQTWAEIEFVASNAGYVRLPHVWHPTLTVSRDGVPITAVASALNFAVVPARPGVNNLELRYGWSRVQLGSLGVSTFVLVLLSGGLGVSLLQARQRTPPGTQ